MQLRRRSYPEFECAGVQSFKRRKTEKTTEDCDSPDAFFSILLRAQDPDPINDSNWLTSPFIDFILFKYAMMYPCVYFLSTDFVPLYLEKDSCIPLLDLLGRSVAFDDPTRPIVFVANVKGIHWNLFRVTHEPEPELQLFEPMGLPEFRNGCVSARCIPKYILKWLDNRFPHAISWKNLTVSAITKRQQSSGFDCGVACLLYAEKCGQGQSRQDINEWTDQLDITTFRKHLQMQWNSYYKPPVS